MSWAPLVIIGLWLCIVYTILTQRRLKITDQKFYHPGQISSRLADIKFSLPEIKREVRAAGSGSGLWLDWPELDLYQDLDKEWRIFPFMAFGKMLPSNCEKCPMLWQFIKSIPGIRVAILSKLGPGMKLTAHQGWAKHSNQVIRCHYGFQVPDGCYLAVADRKDLSDQEARYHHKNEWLCFDDSKWHWAHNPSQDERIVLILDIERPSHIRPGRSEVNDTTELANLLSQF